MGNWRILFDIHLVHLKNIKFLKALTKLCISIITGQHQDELATFFLKKSQTSNSSNSNLLPDPLLCAAILKYKILVEVIHGL